MTEKKDNKFISFIKSLHSDEYRWYDFFLFPLLISYVLMFAGQILGIIITNIPLKLLVNEDNHDFLRILQTYLLFIGMWIVIFLYCLIKGNRPIIKAITPFCKGNTVKYLLLGFLLGFLQNAFCIVIALLHKDIFIYFDAFNILELIVLFLAVFIQSSAEEMLCRGFLYQRLRRSYKNPAIAVIGNAVLFSLLHIGNPGVNGVALLSICMVGLFYSLLVYYCDSIWMPMAAHAAWNYTQNIIFGLPNSGIVSPISIFKLDATTAKDSFAYNVGFGVESTIVAVLLLGVSCLIVYLWGRKRNKKPTDIWK